jgi:hypothetical protein
VGQELDFGEPGLQAPDERLAHRQVIANKKVPTDAEIWA